LNAAATGRSVGPAERFFSSISALTASMRWPRLASSARLTHPVGATTNAQMGALAIVVFKSCRLVMLN
jgi:hypothetical protein